MSFTSASALDMGTLYLCIKARRVHPYIIYQVLYGIKAHTEYMKCVSNKGSDGNRMPDLPSGEDNYRFGENLTHTIRLPIYTIRTLQS